MLDKCWREMIVAEMGDDDSQENIEAIYPPDVDLDGKFDAGYGGSRGAHFTLWTKDWVYFPAVYDGAEWVERVPRNPCDFAMSHVGGE